METVSSRWRKPKGRPSKRRKLASLRAMSRWSSVSKQGQELPESISLCGDTSDEVSLLTEQCNMTVDKNTRSEEKLCCFKNSQVIDEIQGPAFSIVHDSVWKDLLKNLPCEQCGEKSLTVNTLGEWGYSSKLQMNCLACGFIHGTSFSSPRLTMNKKFEINKTMVEAFLNIGKGYAALETFSMTLGINTMDRKTFDKHVLQLVEEGKILKETILQKAREIVRDHQKIVDPSCDEDVIDIGVSYDGTWQKRGHSSLYCIGCVIDILTGIVIDFEVISKYCHDCVKTAADLGKNSAEFSIWYEAHTSSGMCEKNYDGSSGSMEVFAAEMLWKRSVENCKMRYTVLLSDGDSKTYLNLSKSKIYDDRVIIKEECINHVAKRMGTALRNKVKEWRTRGVCLGGKKKGNLTEAIIIKLTNYYRKAIKDNIPDTNKMKAAIFASLYHSMSTNKKPQHQKCPSGSQSWCFYNRALAEGSEIPDHNKMRTKLSEDVVSKILPVYQRLASDEILNRCTSGKTQNSNESVHSVIWKYCPKDTFTSRRRLELAAISAVSQFNMGCEASLTFKENETIRSQSLLIAKKKDERRLKQSVHRNKTTHKNAYKNQKFLKNKKAKKQMQSEGVTYAAGLF